MSDPGVYSLYQEVPTIMEDFKLPREYFSMLGSDVYKNVKDNLYGNVDRTVNQSREFAVKCSCTPTEGCGPDCQNRLLYMECQPGQCPSLELPAAPEFTAPDSVNSSSSSAQTHSLFCKNCAMQERRYPVLQVFQSDLCGFGLKTCEKCDEGTILAEYTGEVITSKECVKRMAEVKKSGTDSFYFASLGEGLFLDAKHFGSIARFANHCCNPNSELQRWVVDGMVRLALVNTRPLTVGEEIVYNYGYAEDGMEDVIKTRQKCYCGASNCCGTIGGKVTTSPIDKWISRASVMLRVKVHGGPSKPTYVRRFTAEEFEEHLSLAAELDASLKALNKTQEGQSVRGQDQAVSRKKRGVDRGTVHVEKMAMDVEVAEAKNFVLVGEDFINGVDVAEDISSFLSYSPECGRLYLMMRHALRRQMEVEKEVIQLREKVANIGVGTSSTATKCYFYEHTTSCLSTRPILPFSLPAAHIKKESKTKSDDVTAAEVVAVAAMTPLLLMNRRQGSQYLESFLTAGTASAADNIDGSNVDICTPGPIGSFMKIDELTWLGELIKQSARVEKRLIEMYKLHLSAINQQERDQGLCQRFSNAESASTFAWSDVMGVVTDLAEVLPILCDDYCPPATGNNFGTNSNSSSETQEPNDDSFAGTADSSASAEVKAISQPINLVISFLYNTVICSYIAILHNSTLYNTTVSMWRHYHCARKAYITHINEAVESNADYLNMEKVFLVYSNVAMLNSRSGIVTGGASRGHSFSHFPTAKQLQQYSNTKNSIRELLRIPFEIHAWLDIYTSIYMNKMISLGVLNKRGFISESHATYSAAVSARLRASRVTSENDTNGGDSCGSHVKKREEEEELHCYCCLPEGEGESGQMLQCEQCLKWFHHSCVNLDPELLRRQLGEAAGRGRKRSDRRAYNCPTCCAQQGYLTSFTVDNNSLGGSNSSLDTSSGTGTIGTAYEWGIPNKTGDNVTANSLYAVASADLVLDFDRAAIIQSCHLQVPPVQTVQPVVSVAPGVVCEKQMDSSSGFSNEVDAGASASGGVEMVVKLKQEPDSSASDSASVLTDSVAIAYTSAVVPTSTGEFVDSSVMTPKKRKRTTAAKKSLDALSISSDSSACLPHRQEQRPVLLSCKTAHSEYYFDRQKLTYILSYLGGNVNAVNVRADSEQLQTPTPPPLVDCVVIGCPIAQLLSLSLSYLNFWEERTKILLLHCADIILQSEMTSSSVSDSNNAVCYILTAACSGSSVDDNSGSSIGVSHNMGHQLANLQECLSEAYYELRVLKVKPSEEGTLTLSLIRSLLWAIGAVPLLYCRSSNSTIAAYSTVHIQTEGIGSGDSAEPVVPEDNSSNHKSVLFSEIRAVMAAGKTFVEHFGSTAASVDGTVVSMNNYGNSKDVWYKWVLSELVKTVDKMSTAEANAITDVDLGTGASAADACSSESSRLSVWLLVETLVMQVYTKLECRYSCLRGLLQRAEYLQARAASGISDGASTIDSGFSLYNDFQKAFAEQGQGYLYDWDLSKEYAYVRLCNLYVSATAVADAVAATSDTAKAMIAGEEEEVPSTELYCWCRRGDLGMPMVGCDGDCGLWFHCECMGFVYKTAEKPKKKRKSKYCGNDAAASRESAEVFVEADTIPEAAESAFYCIACSESKKLPYAYKW